ncbi:MAG: PEP-CTERM sorting domain-containing protein [bacterium]
MSSTAGLGDVAFAVGEYKDFTDSYAYRLNQDITSSQALAQTGINAWAATGGGDYAEAELFALDQLSNNTSWRAGSTRILVWFGDAPGHDPSGGVTEASATAALQSKSIVVEAIDVGTLDAYGQATRIAAATGGAYYPGIDTNSIVDTIQAAITSVFTTYSTVGLDLSEVPVGVTVTAAPGSYSGSYDRSVARTFNFNVTFTGDAAGTYDFNLYGTVDGGRVATEADHINVGVPEPSMLLLSIAMMGIFGFAIKKRT